jgi:hypothetical protein
VVCFLFAAWQTPTTPAMLGLQKDPTEWKTGDEPMTAAQRSYLENVVL